MLFPDIHLPLPRGSRYEIISPRNGDVYLRYRIRSFTEDGRKKHERITIGRVFEDEQTNLKYFCPNENYYLKLLNEPLPVNFRVKGRGRRRAGAKLQNIDTPDGSSMAFGYMLACWSVVKELGLDQMLGDCFGSLKNSIIAAASFFAAGAPGGLSNIDHFTRKNMCFIPHVIDAAGLSELYGELNEPMRNDFFRKWVKYCQEDDFLCYDVTSVSSCSEKLPFVAWGYNRDQEQLPQFNLGMFCSMKRGLPVYFCPYTGSINDFTNFPYIAEHARAVGITEIRGITLVMDGGFAVPETIANAVSHGFELVIGAPGGFGVRIRDSLLEWRRSAAADNQVFRLPDESIRYHETELNVGRVKARLLLYRSPQAGLREETALNSLVNRLEAELKERRRISQTLAEQYQPFFEISVNEAGSGFSYRFKNDVFTDALKLCGCFALLCTRSDLSCEQILHIYRAKDTVEKAFGTLKNDILGERMHTKTIEGTNGKLFLAFIGLIIRKTLEKKLRPYLNRTRMGLDSAFSRLADLSCMKAGELWILDKALTKQQKELAEILQLPVSRLEAA